MTDKLEKICQYCKNRHNKKCVVTGKYVARKKSCDNPDQFSGKGK